MYLLDRLEMLPGHCLGQLLTMPAVGRSYYVNLLLWKSLADQPDSGCKVGVPAHQHRSVVLVLIGVIEHPHGDLHVRLFLFVNDPGCPATPARAVLLVELRHDGSYADRLLGTNILSVPPERRVSPPCESGEIIDSTQLVHGGIEKEGSQPTQIHPLVVVFSEGVYRVIEVEAVDVTVNSLHDPPQKKATSVARGRPWDLPTGMNYEQYGVYPSVMSSR